MSCPLYVFVCAHRFPPVSEKAPVRTVVGVILASAINQSIVYSIIEGNEGGECSLSPAHCTDEQVYLTYSSSLNRVNAANKDYIQEET